MTPTEAILELIKSAADGVTVVLADEGGAPPKSPCITVALRASQASPAEAGPVEASGDQPVRQHDDATVELKSFGGHAADRLDGLALRLRHPLYEERAEALGLAVFRAGRLNVDQPDHGRAEPASVLEVGIRYARVQAAPVGLIETVEGRFTTSAGLTPDTETSFTATVVPAK